MHGVTAQPLRPSPSPLPGLGWGWGLRDHTVRLGKGVPPVASP